MADVLADLGAFGVENEGDAADKKKQERELDKKRREKIDKKENLEAMADAQAKHNERTAGAYGMYNSNNGFDRAGAIPDVYKALRSQGGHYSGLIGRFRAVKDAVGGFLEENRKRTGGIVYVSAKNMQKLQEAKEKKQTGLGSGNAKGMDNAPSAQGYGGNGRGGAPGAARNGGQGLNYQDIAAIAQSLGADQRGVVNGGNKIIDAGAQNKDGFPAHLYDEKLKPFFVEVQGGVGKCKELFEKLKKSGQYAHLANASGYGLIAVKKGDEQKYAQARGGRAAQKKEPEMAKQRSMKQEKTMAKSGRGR